MDDHRNLFSVAFYTRNPIIPYSHISVQTMQSWPFADCAQRGMFSIYKISTRYDIGLLLSTENNEICTQGKHRRPRSDLSTAIVLQSAPPHSCLNEPITHIIEPLAILPPESPFLQQRIYRRSGSDLFFAEETLFRFFSPAVDDVGGGVYMRSGRASECARLLRRFGDVAYLSR